MVPTGLSHCSRPDGKADLPVDTGSLTGVIEPGPGQFTYISLGHHALLALPAQSTKKLSSSLCCKLIGDIWFALLPGQAAACPDA